MTLFFEEKDDVKLRRSPLVQVICQVRFDPILRIGSEEPAAFQEKIRHRFPQFRFDQTFGFQIPSTVSPESLPRFEPAPREYRFSTEDDKTTATLAQGFFALSTDLYTVWEDFAKDLDLVGKAVTDVYRPARATRIGLRYVNEISADKVGLQTLDEVIELLQQDLVSPLTSGAWSTPRAYVSRLDLEDSDGTLAIRVALQSVDGAETRSLLLDFDYYQEGSLQLEDLIPRCNHYHSVIYNAFRWAIREDRLSVFDPIR